MIRVLFALLVLVATVPASAQPLRCAAPARCTGPGLRAADAEIHRLFAQLRAAAPPALRARLVAGQRAWRRVCVRGCPADRLIARRDALRALAATLSAPNPTLSGANAVWLDGTYTLAPLRGLGGWPAPRRVFGMMPAGTVLRLSAGQDCAAASCGSFGLVAERLAGGPGRQALPAMLGLAKDAPFYLVMRDGLAAFGLVGAPHGHLFALIDGCAGSGAPCGWIAQDWVPAPGARLHAIDLAAPAAAAGSK